MLTLTAALMAAHLGGAIAKTPEFTPPVQQVQYGRRGYGGHPPPCGNGEDQDVRNGWCYPNGVIPPQFQTGRQHQYQQYPEPQYREYGRPRRDDYGYQVRRPVRCGNGADLDVRDGLCYPNGQVPPQFQNRPQRYRY